MLFGLLAASYGLYLALASAQAGRQAGGSWPVAWRLPAVIAAYQIGYGLGGWRGLWDVWRGRRVSGAAARLTR